MFLRLVSYSTLREDKLKTLEEDKKEEERFTRFHDEVTTSECSMSIFQCELVDEAKMKLEKKKI